MLTALGSGTLFGTIGGTAIDPTLKPAPEQPWRQGLGPQNLPSANLAMAEAPPQDLSPQGWTYGAARAFPRDIDRPSARQVGYRWNDQALNAAADAGNDGGWNYAAAPEDEPVRASEAAPVAVDVPAAEAARDAALDATEQGIDPAPANPPTI